MMDWKVREGICVFKLWERNRETRQTYINLFYHIIYNKTIKNTTYNNKTTKK